MSADDDGGLFAVLNSHATMVVADRDRGRPGPGPVLPRDLEDAFQALLRNVRGYWPVRPDKDHTSPLGLAYVKYLDVLGKYNNKNGK